MRIQCTLSPFVGADRPLKWLGSHDKQDLVNFQDARGKVRIMNQRFKNEWFKKKMEEAQKERFGDKTVSSV